MAKPFIKWVGGKGKLINEIKKRMPSNYENFVEPFVGGGSVFLSLAPSSVVINDLNKDLINVYIQIKNNPEEVIKALNELQTTFNSFETEEERAKFFYDCRNEFNATINNDLSELTIKDASLFIFLNKTGFNGIYRVNASGLFNVPFGKKKNISTYDKQNILDISKALQNAIILNGDFETCCSNLHKNDFVFFDSPYYDTFTSYQKTGFTDKDHTRLSLLFQSLSDNGVYCMLTNSNTDFIKNLYSNYHIEEVDTYHCVNSNGNDRKRKEIIITNY